jgi:hypothetical protein
MVVDDAIAFIQSFNWVTKNLTDTRDYAIVTTASTGRRLRATGVIKAIRAAQRIAHTTVAGVRTFGMETVWRREWRLAEVLRRQLVSGAGYGDRTRVRGLGSLCTTIVLSPLGRVRRSLYSEVESNTDPSLKSAGDDIRRACNTCGERRRRT